jgi:hypothetical protein
MHPATIPVINVPATTMPALPVNPLEEVAVFGVDSVD